MQAKFIHNGDAIDYQPSVDVAAGTVVWNGSLAGIAMVDIPAGTLGALAVVGVFDVTKGGSTFAAGDAVYWNETDNIAGANASGQYLGRAVVAAAATDPVVRVRLEPSGGTITSAASSTGTGITIQSYIASLTNNTGGIESNLLSAPSAAYSQAELANALSSLARKVNEVVNALRGAGVISNTPS